MATPATRVADRALVAMNIVAWASPDPGAMLCSELMARDVASDSSNATVKSSAPSSGSYDDAGRLSHFRLG